MMSSSPSTSSQQTFPEPPESKRLRRYALSFLFVMWFIVLWFAVGGLVGETVEKWIPLLIIVCLLGIGVFVMILMRAAVRETARHYVQQQLRLSLRKKIALTLATFVCCAIIYFALGYWLWKYPIQTALADAIGFGIVFTLFNPNSGISILGAPKSQKNSTAA